MYLFLHGYLYEKTFQNVSPTKTPLSSPTSETITGKGRGDGGVYE